MNMNTRLLWDMNITKRPSPHLLYGDINVCKARQFTGLYIRRDYIISFYLLHPFPELETNNPTVFIQALVFNLCTCSLVYTTVNFVNTTIGIL